jgi:hypothetical protein
MQMTKLTLFILLIAGLCLAACSALVVTPAPAGEEPTPVLAPVSTTATAETPPGAYPGDVVAPEADATTAGYPAQPETQPEAEAYPGGLVWVIRPVGVQCEQGTAEGYGDLTEAVATLSASGVEVAASEMTNRIVTTVCGAPTSAHFRVQIAADSLDTAVNMGWEAEGG